MNQASPSSAPDGERAGLAKDLSARVGSAAVLVAIAAIGLYLGGVWTGIIAAAFVAAIHYEWASMTDGSFLPSLPYTAAAAAATVVAGFGMVLPAILVVLVAVIVSAVMRREPWQPVGIVYAGALGISLVAIRIAPFDGVTALVFLFAVVAGTDTAAYLVGRTVGGAKLWPRVSPNKTWAGTIGGLAGGIVIGLVVAHFSGIGPTAGLAFVALLLSIVGQAGDLFESWVKRRFGKKDSGRMLPGHGGMMDRLDSLTFASVVAVAVGWAHLGPSDLARGLLRW